MWGVRYPRVLKYASSRLTTSAPHQISTGWGSEEDARTLALQLFRASWMSIRMTSEPHIMCVDSNGGSRASCLRLPSAVLIPSVYISVSKWVAYV